MFNALDSLYEELVSKENKENPVAETAAVLSETRAQTEEEVIEKFLAYTSKLTSPHPEEEIIQIPVTSEVERGPIAIPVTIKIQERKPGVKTTDRTAALSMHKALIRAYALKDISAQTHKINKLLFPLVVRNNSGVSVKDRPFLPTPENMVELFEALDGTGAPNIIEDRKFLYVYKKFPSIVSATCPMVQLRHIPVPLFAENKVFCKLRSIQGRPVVSHCCPSIKPFNTSEYFGKYYNGISLKVDKEDGTLKNWVIGLHPDRPNTHSNKELCLLGDPVSVGL